MLIVAALGFPSAKLSSLLDEGGVTGGVTGGVVGVIFELEINISSILII